jgi:hypothetical protein
MLTVNEAHAQLGKAEVQGVKGSASYTYGGGSPLQCGAAWPFRQVQWSGWIAIPRLICI